MVRDTVEVLVAAAGEIDHQQVIRGLARRNVAELGQRMARLERRDDAFEPAAKLERGERFLVGRGQELDPPEIGEPRVLRPDARIVETGPEITRKEWFYVIAMLVLMMLGTINIRMAEMRARNEKTMPLIDPTRRPRQ